MSSFSNLLFNDKSLFLLKKEGVPVEPSKNLKSQETINNQ